MGAGDWIKWEKGLTRKREVIAIAAALNLPGLAGRRVVACACMEFWEWADSETTNGDLPGVSPLFIDELVSLPHFSDALLAVDWLRLCSPPSSAPGDRGVHPGVSIPNWNRHNGESAKQRARNSRNQARARAAAPSVNGNGRHRHVTGLSPPNGDKPVTSEEREREREKTSSLLREEAREPASGSRSPPARAQARMTWLARILPLFSPDKRQKLSDKTSAERLFDDVIWPDDTPADAAKRAADRYRLALDLIPRSSGRGNRMAWITTVIQQEMPEDFP